jgi:hydroxypyruvate isomerase
MPLKYCINLSMIYTEFPFLDRFAMAARAGFTAVEFLFPYEFDLTQIKARLENLGMVQVLFNLQAGDSEAGELGTLSNPRRRAYFRRSFAKALDVAVFLNCARLHVLFGNKVAGIKRDEQVECAVENLSWAAPLAAAAEVTLLLEPLNETDFPSYFLHRTAEALNVITQVNHPHVKLQYDIYHAQMTEGNLINTLASCMPDIGHIQIGDVPGRNQPGTGEINYPAIWAALRKQNYSGYIGLEYRPSNDSDSSLAWLPREQRGQMSSQGF